MSPEFRAVFWALITLAVYLISRGLHQRFGTWWSSPILLTWVVCGLLILGLHSSYQEYLGGTGWIAALIGPATVAFAIPVHENRTLIRRHWPLLAIGTLAGSVIALASSWLLARVFNLSPELQASLLPRSITTPFAMTVSRDLGGLPELTAAFTAVTGIFGATIGEGLLTVLPIRSSFARGAFLGMGAHGAGVAKARELGEEEGAIAGLIMVFAGLLNVLGAVFLLPLF